MNRDYIFSNLSAIAGCCLQLTFPDFCCQAPFEDALWRCPLDRKEVQAVRIWLFGSYPMGLPLDLLHPVTSRLSRKSLWPRLGSFLTEGGIIRMTWK